MNTLSNQEALFSSPTLNVAAIAAHTDALGPGPRAAIWVQGCPLHCPGCVAPNWIPFVPALQLAPDEILQKLDLEAIRGLTFSGGEPMEQAAGLAALARLARREKALDVICYTGYRYENLLKQPPNVGVSELLAEIDVLIDGPFIQALNNAVGLRGSTNQRIIHLTSALTEFNFESNARRIELTITDGELGIIGIPTPGILSALQTTSQELERKESNEWL